MDSQFFAYALYDKYYKPGATICTKRNDDGSWEITDWKHPDGIPQPDESQILTAISEFQTKKDSEDTAKKGRKRQLLDSLATLTGLTRKQVLKCFMEIVKDGTDD